MPNASLRDALAQLDPASPRYATDVVERVLAEAQKAGASDVHFQPGGDGLELRWRIDGVLAAGRACCRRRSRPTSSPGSRCWPSC